MPGRSACRCSACSRTGRSWPSSRQALAERAASLRVGDPLLAETEVGPLIRPKEVERVHAWVEEAVARGAQLLCGGERAVGNLLRADRAAGAAAGLPRVDPGGVRAGRVRLWLRRSGRGDRARQRAALGLPGGGVHPRPRHRDARLRAGSTPRPSCSTTTPRSASTGCRSPACANRASASAASPTPSTTCRSRSSSWGRCHEDQSCRAERHGHAWPIRDLEAAGDRGARARPAGAGRGAGADQGRGPVPFRPVGDQRRPAAAAADGARATRRPASSRRSGRASPTSPAAITWSASSCPSCGHCGPCAEGRPALCEPGAAVNGAGTLLSGARRLHRAGRHAGPASSGRLGLRRVRHGLAPFAGQDRPRAAARRGSPVRLRRAHRRGCGGQHRPGPGRRLDGGDRAGRRRPVLAAGCDRRRCARDRRHRPRRRQARLRPPARRHRDLQRQGPGLRRAGAERHRRRGRVRLRARGLGPGAGARLQDHPPRRHHGDRGPAAADRHHGPAGGQPRGRGADAEGQLYRHRGAEPRHPALHPALPARPAAGRPADERHA